MKKVIAIALISILVMGFFTGCGKKKDEADIYFLNFKPEVTDAYEKIAAQYEKETGVKIKIITAASGEYESTLKAEMAKREVPTIFQINGPVGYETWKDYCADLLSTSLYTELADQSLCVTSGTGVYGIPCVIEGYGILYNDAIMQKYFALDTRETQYDSMDEIQSYAALKILTEDMTRHKDELGIEGVFASTSLGNGQQWRWQSHLANIPFYYEFSENTGYSNPTLAGLASDEIEFKYGANFKNIFDLYINNSCSEKTLLDTKSVDDSMCEFALGQCAMVQNGNWAWSQISSVNGNTVAAEDIKMLPIYTGIAGEASQGICIGTENYLAVNCQVSKDKQQKAIDFLEWLYTSDEGKEFVVNDLGFITPFKGYDDYTYADPLSQQVKDWVNDESKKNIPWVFQSFPNTVFKDEFGEQLNEYAQGNVTWSQLVDNVKKYWNEEKTAE